PELRELVDSSYHKDGPDSPRYASQLFRLSGNLLEQKKYAEAESLARSCLTIRTKHEPDAWTTFFTQSLLGSTLLAQEKYADAEPLVVQGYRGMKERVTKIPKNGRDRLAQALERLVQFHDARGNKAEAERLRKELEAEKSEPRR